MSSKFSNNYFIHFLFHRGIISFILLFLSVSVFAQRPHKVSIILDTDIAPDYDDVGAMALLHAFADKGEAVILATISSNAFKTTALTLSVLNTYFGRPGIPIGITKKMLKEMSQTLRASLLALPRTFALIR